MKHLFIFFNICLLFVSCDVRNLKSKKDVFISSSQPAFKDSTTVTVIDSLYNFGKVTDGDKVSYDFRFKNTGTHPLIIQSATPSCGCTIADKPEKPVLSGETGVIKVVFNSSGRLGKAIKAITVTSNAYPAFPPLQLVGEVVNK